MITGNLSTTLRLVPDITWIRATRVRYRLAELQCRSRRRIHLVHMMCFVDLNREVSAQRRSGLSTEVFEDGNAKAHIAVIDHGDRFCRLVE